MTIEDRSSVERLLADYADVFVAPDGKLGTTHKAEHVIDTGDNPPVKQQPYRMSAEGHRIVGKECEEMLRKGVIRES